MLVLYMLAQHPLRREQRVERNRSVWESFPRAYAYPGRSRIDYEPIWRLQFYENNEISKIVENL